MVEIVGFNDAYANARNIEMVKKYAKQAMNKKIKKLVDELIADGMEAAMAKSIAKSMAEAGLI